MTDEQPRRKRSQPVLTLGRLIELRAFVDPGPWRAGRSDFDGSLILFDSGGNPIALIYGGHDLAVYLEACAPSTLLGPPQ